MRSMNGWPASPDLPLRALIVRGVPFVPGILDHDDVATVLGYVVTEYAERVEALASPGCWGFAFRANVNDPDSLSNHSSGTAVDVNAPFHPNGVRATATFSAAQIAEVHRILAEVDHAVRWGGDFSGTPDAMHFEVNVTPAELATVARRLIEEGTEVGPKDWTDEDWAAIEKRGGPIFGRAVWLYQGIDNAGTKAKAVVAAIGSKLGVFPIKSDD